MPYPYLYTIGERYAVDNQPGSEFYQPPCAESIIPDEGRARVLAGVELDCDRAGPRGRPLKFVSLAAVSEYGVGAGSEISDRDVGPPYLGQGYIIQGDSGPRGRLVRPFITIGCRAGGDGAPGFRVEEMPEAGIVAEAQRIQETAGLKAFLDTTSGARGRLLAFEGSGGCPGVLEYGLDPDAPPDEAASIYHYGSHDKIGELYHYDVFGQRCVSCPILFVTFQRPCIDCSYRPEDFGYIVGGLLAPRGNVCGDAHSETVTDWCAAGGATPVDLGKAHCIPLYATNDPRYDPQWGIACRFKRSDPANPNSPLIVDAEHHCEECVYERNLGFLIRLVLEQSDCLSKLPMRPVHYSDPRHNCAYGCGQFGWTLWSANPTGGLQIPWRNWPAAGVDQVWVGNEFVTSMETPCTGEYCRGPSGNGAHESGFSMCGKGVQCECDPLHSIFCATTHKFMWNRTGTNRIAKAYVCFKQWEACGQAPCPSDPIQTPGVYHAPPSTMLVWVDCYVEIEMTFHHWGPMDNNGGPCGCCGFDSVVTRDSILVKLVGEFCGPVPWGGFVNANWVGFESNEAARVANYPGTFLDPQNADGADARGACGSMFVDQGTYGDGLDGQPSSNPAFNFFDEAGEPPKRCPSRIAGPKFWCPPSLRWRWSYTGGTHNWVPLSRPANKRIAANQCWGLQLAKNDGSGCARGRLNSLETGVAAVGCHSPDCRRGCSLEETKDGDGLRISPWQQFRATPWGCGHCVDEYPPDPFAAF